MYIDSASGNSAADHNTCQSLALIKYCQIRTKQTRRIEKITEKISAKIELNSEFKKFLKFLKWPGL